MPPDPTARDRLAALAAGPDDLVRPVDPVDPVEPVEPVAPIDPVEPVPGPGAGAPRRVRRAGPVPPADPPRWSPDPVRWSPGAVLDRLGVPTRWRALRVEVGIGVVVVALVAVVAGAVWYRMGAAPPDRPARAAGSGPGAGAAADGPGATGAPGAGTASDVRSAPAGRTAPGVVVHVAGAVAQPGVLRMPEGARVIDAVEGAGGAVPTADLDRLNLAARLTDGQRILVLEVGAAPVAAGPGTGGVTDPGALLDLNAATQAQLEALPGIGPALAGAILAERDRRGGFRSVNELREVRGIGEARFADLRARVTV